MTMTNDIKQMEAMAYDLSGAFDLSLLPAGAAGTNAEGDVLTQTLDGRSLNDVWTEIQASLALWNDKRQAIVDLLTFPVQNPIEEVPVYSGDDFEEASEFGEPKGVRGGDFFQMAYDFKWYDLAVRFTWKFLAEATAAQVESLANRAFEADNRLVFSRVLRAVFNNVNTTASIRSQAYNVYRFYNADGTVPPDYKNDTFSGTHNHYLTSGAATIDSGDLDAIEEHIKHHGYLEGGATLVIMMNRQEVATVRSFRVSGGDSFDFIPSQGSPAAYFPQMVLGVTGNQPPSEYRGLKVAGSYGPFLIIEEDFIPAGYVFAFATGGEQNVANPVGFREHQNAGLRGLRLVKGRDNDYPLIDSFYQRGFGTGIRHRGAGVVMEITADATYDIPAAYA